MTTPDTGRGAAAEHKLEATFAPIPRADADAEIDLVALLHQYLTHLWGIALCALAGALLAAGYTFFVATPVYEATAKLYVLNATDSALNLSDLQIGTYLANDYMEVFKTWEVHEMVKTNLRLPYTYAQLQAMLTVENPGDTRLLYLTVRSQSAQESAAIANEYAAVAIKYIADTMATEEPNIMSVALMPANPSAPNHAQGILLGFGAGLLIALAWITLRFVMDDRIQTMDDIRQYVGLPTLAVVPYNSLGAPRRGKPSQRRGSGL